MQKVVTRDSLHYRKLTDKLKDEVKDNSSVKVNGENSAEDLEDLGLG